MSYAGINSSVNQSGKFELEGGSITKHGSPYLRRALYLAAQGAYRLDPRPARLLRQEEERGQVPQGRRDGRSQKALPHHLRDPARPGPIRAAGLSCATSFFSKVAMALFHCA